MFPLEEVSRIIRSYLPEAPADVISRLSSEICREMELTLFAQIRDAVEEYTKKGPQT